MSDKMAPALDAMGRRIRVLRAERGLSCRDLAALIGVSPMAVSKWENGAAPTSTNLLAVARALGCSVEFLLGDWRRDVADLRLAVRIERDDGTVAADDAYARGFAAAREAAAAALSRLTAQWPHVGPVPPTVRGEWALRDKALPAIRAIRPEEPSA